MDISLRKTVLAAVLICASIQASAQGSLTNRAASADFTNSIGMKLVFVSGGSFTMGDTAGENDERPIRRISVGDFLIASTEVTQGQWKSVMGTSIAFPMNQGDDNPVDRATWFKAVEFCNKLSEKEGLRPAYAIDGLSVSWITGANGYRLPTEAEWEYAAGGGQTRRNPPFKYAGSNKVDEVAWVDPESNFKNAVSKVARKKANALGLYDMSGNVWEWCWDWYGAYSDRELIDPRGPATGSQRVLRGGAFYFSANFARVSYRYRAHPKLEYIANGFRVVLTAAGK